MKRKLSYLLFLSIVVSACSEFKSSGRLPKDSENGVNPDTGYYLTSNEGTKVYKVGEQYSAKVYLNDNSLYSKYNITPIIVLKHGRFEDIGFDNRPWERIKVVGDTGFIEFKIIDDSIKVGEEKIKKWSARIKIPLPEKDTSFALTTDYVIKK